MERFEVDGVALHGRRDGVVRFGFTERIGGVSRAPCASLNLGSHVGDDLAAVQENRRRALAALGCADDFGRLLVPNQIHGDHVAVVRSSAPDELARGRAEIAEGADAIVCMAPHVPVLLCFADCVPVILTCGDAFTVVHSGWKGTYARIAAKAARVLLRETGASPERLRAYSGPHILGDEYEVSADLFTMFSEQFDNLKVSVHRMLDLSACIRQSLEEVGVFPCEIHDPQLSTGRQNDLFFSYRAEKGLCGRHGAIACVCS